MMIEVMNLVLKARIFYTFSSAGDKGGGTGAYGAPLLAGANF
jgi:hypothetical protein